MPAFLNSCELVTYQRIREVADRFGAHVFSKVRLADIVPINGSGIADDLFSYALKAHVDFLVTDAQQEPQFCVEFDGPTHQTTAQQQRDAMKNQILDCFQMPFIRINSRYLTDNYRGFDLLSYFVDVWFLSIAFDAAQEAGSVPCDECFDPNLILSDGRTNGVRWPYWLSLEPQLELKQLHKAGRIAQPTPSYWAGRDTNEALRCLAYIFLSKDQCVYVETGMQRQRFPAVCQSDLLPQIATHDLFTRVMSVLDGKIMPQSKDDLVSTLDQYASTFSPASSASCSFPQ